MSDRDENRFNGIIFSRKPQEVGERLAEQFHKDMRDCRVFKDESGSQIQGTFKKPMSAQEIIERTREALED